MTNYRWSKYIRGLDCGEGWGIMHSMLHQHPKICSDQLLMLVESGEVAGLPEDLLRSFIEHAFLVPTESVEENQLDSRLHERLLKAEKGELVTACKLESIPADLHALSSLFKEMAELFRPNTLTIFLPFDTALLNLLTAYLGHFHFIFYVGEPTSLTTISQADLTRLETQNLGLYVKSGNLTEITSEIELELERVAKAGCPLAVELEFADVEELAKVERIAQHSPVNLRLTGNGRTQDILVELYHRVSELRQTCPGIQCSWDVPLNRLIEGLTAKYFGGLCLTIKGMASFKELCAGTDYLASVRQIPGNLPHCWGCGLEGICAGYLVGTDAANADKCFLAKYAVREYVLQLGGS